MMKSNYKLNKPIGYIYNGEWHEYSTPGIYQHKYIRQLRYPRTHNERWQNERDKEFVRGRRRKLPSSWDDLRPSFFFGSDWKRFTKKRKQYS